jgi:hypothetical protein
MAPVCVCVCIPDVWVTKIRKKERLIICALYDWVCEGRSPVRTCSPKLITQLRHHCCCCRSRPVVVVVVMLTSYAVERLTSESLKVQNGKCCWISSLINIIIQIYKRKSSGLDWIECTQMSSCFVCLRREYVYSVNIIPDSFQPELLYAKVVCQG